MRRHLYAAVAGSSLSVALSAQAQVTPTATAAVPRSAEAPEAPVDLTEVVVTGTLIRGIAPTGTETETVTAKDIEEAGGLSTNDALARIPQITNFFNTQIVAAPGQLHGIDQPTIHGLPTLIMLDGARIAPAGTNSTTSVDPSIIPKGLLEQIEIIPDGGSALYGSDAVGGVINLSTKNRFDGVDVDGNVGFANGYQSYRVDLTAGKTWSTGSAYLAYAFDKQTPLFGYDRPYLQRVPPLTECYPGTVNVSIFNLTTFSNSPVGQFSYPGVGANGKPTAYTTGAAACNEYTHESVTPEEHMNSVFAGVSQEFGSSIRVDARAFYSSRPSTSYNTFNTYTDGAVPSTNFYYTPTPPQLAPFSACAFLCSQSVGISFAPAVGANIASSTKLETWGASSNLTADVGHSFQMRLLGSFSESLVHSTAIGVDSGLLTKALASGNEVTALDPYNVAASPESATLARQIDDQQTYSRGRTELAQGRVVADGTLVQIPGGDVKIATGGEVIHEIFFSQVQPLTYNGGIYQPPQTTDAARTVSSAFGETEIPLVSPDNHVPLLYSLRGSVAGRFDHYSDFGNTFDPRFAVSLMPTEWLTVRATDGRSFLAPDLTQEFTAQLGTIAPGIPFLLPPGDTQDAFKNLIILTGGNPALQAQKARTYSLGGDLTVPSIEGLKLSVTYYNARYTNQITTAPFTMPSVFYTPTYAPFYLRNPSYAAAAALIGKTPVSGIGFTSLAQLYGPGGAITASSPVIIADARYNNLAIVKTDGLDFDARYKRPTSVGVLNFEVAGNYVLTDNTSPVSGAAFTNQLLTTTRFNGSVAAGGNVYNLRFTANVLHTGGYGLTPGVSPFGQTRVKPYNTVNTFLSYRITGLGFADGTDLSFNLNNILNAKPPVNTAVSLGYAGGSIIGRTFQLGLHKKF